METIEAGELLLYKPGDLYELKVGDWEHQDKKDPEAADEEKEELRLSSGDYYIFCEGEWIEKWWERTPRVPRWRIHSEERLVVLWRQLILEKRRFESENKELAAHLLQALCLTIDRALTETAAHSGKQYTASRMKAFILERATSSFKIEEVARHVGLSVSRAVHLFKETFGVSMVQYTNDLRLSTSVERMRYSRLSLEQVAETSGFSSYSYFHRVFRQKYGLSPTQYLNSMKETMPKDS
jgi:AraC family transcriptional regulator of arabinose operon